MNALPTTEVVTLPETLRRKLHAYRARFRTVKMTEVGLAAGFGLIVSWLLVLGLDRLFDTPSLLRFAILIAGVIGAVVMVPLQAWRWVWRSRRLDAVARVLLRKDPVAGDQLLGALELTDKNREPDRSPALCRAAVAQVDKALADRDLEPAVPDSRHRAWAKALALPAALSAAAFVFIPAAATNALQRWLMPFGDVTRYTFVQIGELPSSMVVAKGESFTVKVPLEASSRRRPDRGSLRVDDRDPAEAILDDDTYVFEIAGLTQPVTLAVAIGDARHEIVVEPLDRPSIVSLDAAIRLPAYLERDEPLERDARSGVATAVEGSRVAFAAEVSRALGNARLGDVDLVVDGTRLVVPETAADTFATQALHWTDEHGLTAQEPFPLTVRTVPDEAPAVYCDGLQREIVVLDSDTVSFSIQASDDFGVRAVGMEWRSVEKFTNPSEPGHGEKTVAFGGPGRVELDATATFCAKALEIPAQTLELRAWTTDALPGRERVYSPPYTVIVMTPSEHMIWLTQQLDRWLAQAVEVRDRERELLKTNKELRDTAEADLAKPETLRRLQGQVAAERANSRRLSGVVDSGQELLTQAARNSEFNSNTLDDWAKMLKILDDIAANRMPSVADLLAQAKAAAGSKPTPMTTPSAGTIRDTAAGMPGEGDDEETAKASPPVPSVVDVESGFMPPDEEGDPKPPSSSKSRLTLPTTVLNGGTPPSTEEDDARAPEPMEDAVAKQEDLLREFDKVAGKINEILRNLEGSTFVKRLKSASRKQTQVADDINTTLENAFGRSAFEAADASKKLVSEVALREATERATVGRIQDDMSAYIERLDGRPEQDKFRGVFDEMREVRVGQELEEIGKDAVANYVGDAMTDAEFWSDTLDRWAEELVGPG